MSTEDLSYKVRGAIFAVHRELGPGLLESIYCMALLIEFRSLGLKVNCEVGIPVFYKGEDLGLGFRMDLVVEETVVIEVKSVESLHNVHKKQLLTYLRLAKKKLGFLVNFNDSFLEEKVSLIRIIN